jgi:SWI/SNF-related matrix-associated actin-dependent regulator 1 of chromatin subfamily A
MGLGKSLQSVIAALESGSKRILVVCPSSAKINWEREINYFQEYDTAIIGGSRWSTAKFTIINFDILKNFHTLKGDKNDGMPPLRDLVNANFDLCIVDEAHNLRNHKSIRGAIMTEVCVDYGIKKVWLLSGTPVANRPMDFYNLLKLIKSPLVDNWKFYAQRYCEGKQITQRLKNGKKRKIWLTNGASNLDELSIKTRNLLLRRMKDEVLDMPDKTRVPNYYQMSSKQRLEYESLWEDYLIERQKKKKKGSVQRDLVELGLLRKYIAMQTIPETINLIDEIIEQGHKVIIFTCFTDELLSLSEYYGSNCVLHYGEMNETEKQKSVDRFQQEGGPMVFIGNIISAGVAITLTRSTYVVFNSFDWVPGNSEQAEDRSYRLGQKNNVTVYYNLFENTIVSRMWGTLNRKKDIIGQIMARNENNSDAIEEIVDYIIEDKKD